MAKKRRQSRKNSTMGSKKIDSTTERDRRQPSKALRNTRPTPPSATFVYVLSIGEIALLPGARFLVIDWEANGVFPFRGLLMSVYIGRRYGK